MSEVGIERDVLVFYTDAHHPENGVIAPPSTSFKCPIRVPSDGVLRRFFVQMPSGLAYLVTARLFYETECKVPLPGFGYITLDNAEYDNQNLHIPVASGKYLYLEVVNYSALQQKLLALVEVDSITTIVPTNRVLPGRPIDP